MKLTHLLIAHAIAIAGAVVELTTDTFDEFIEKNPIALVKFMAPWCGHCKTLAPEYEAAAEILKKEGGYALAEVDATANLELSGRFDVQGFPTIILFRDAVPEDYTGGRTSALIVEWMKNATSVPVSWTDSLASVLAAEAPGVKIVLSVTAKTEDVATDFENYANKNRSFGKYFAYVGSTTTVTVIRPSEDHVVLESPTAATLAELIAAEHLPLFGPVNGSNFSAYSKRSTNWFWFAGDASEFETAAPAVREISSKHRKEFNFVWLDTGVFARHAEQMLGLPSTPAFSIEYAKQKFHPTFGLEASVDTIEAYLKTVIDGKADVFVRSEEIPELQDSPVRKVVGKSFQDEVLRKDKDVFLKVFAPWCGHCKSMAPAWTELAQKFEKEDRLVIAELDGSANEITVPGFEFQGFPTLFYVKAGEATPLKFSGARELAEFEEYIKANASFEVDISSNPKEEL